MLRIISLFVTLFTSAIYIALTNFHSEMIPPDLLLAIAATRERVPFPIIIEVLVMELAFELIREAGIRVPAPIGPTIGIVGALILGQAAVQANVVSPIIVIVVALGGLSSFVIGDISLNFAVRISRYFLMISAFFIWHIRFNRYIYNGSSLFGFYQIIWHLLLGTSYTKLPTIQSDHL
ncbi:spore germination protein [Virgibacillus halophilus]|uniref:Spore germination protein n=1 Tax=Tigheibacillus halophilus TaxID=361280 RepID=A0ABU5CA53_9BACI|nr:spore germination protein [Virgibacillus halophilus]